MKKAREIEVRLFAFKLKTLYFYSFVSLLVIFSLFIRGFNLTKLPIFADEAIYIRWSQVMKAVESLRFLPLSDGKQPLFMWVVIPFLKIFSDPLVAGRFVSVLSGAGNLLGVIFLSRLLFRSEKLALLAGVFYMLSPFSYFFDRMALVDSLLTMFGLWSFYFLVKAVKELKVEFFILAGISFGFAMLTKSPAIFFLLLSPSVFIFINSPKNKKKRLEYFVRLLSFSVFTYAISFAMYNILRLGPNFHLLSSRNLDYVYPIGHILLDTFNPFVPHINDVVEWFAKLGPFPVFLFFIGALVWGIRNKCKEVLFVLVLFIIPLFVQMEYAKVFTARYILFTLPYLFILLPIAFRNKKFSLRLFYAATFFVFVIFSMWQIFWLMKNPARVALPANERSGYLEEWTAGTGIKEVSDYIIDYQQKNPNEKIVVGTEGYFGTLPDGLQIYLNNYPQITVIGTGIDFKEIPSSLIESKNAGNSTFFVVNDTRIQIQSFENLELINSFPKAEKAGKREKLLFYRII